MLNQLRRRLRPARELHILSSLDAYAQWAVNYPAHAHNPLMEAEEQAMLSLMPDVRGKTVLDLACGTGRYGRLALERGAITAIGLDNSVAMLRANKLRLIGQSSVEAIPLANQSLDVVLCGLALGHLPSLQASLSEISRILKSGGIALVSDFHPFLFLNGARRTFTGSDGQTYAVEHYAHLYADYHRVAQAVGLQVESVLEPKLGDDAKSPVVIVFKFVKR